MFVLVPYRSDSEKHEDTKIQRAKKRVESCNCNYIEIKMTLSSFIILYFFKIIVCVCVCVFYLCLSTVFFFLKNDGHGH